MKHSLVIIPTYNEFENIGPLTTRLLEISDLYDILVVDDSSPDGTDRVVLQLQKTDDRIHLLSRPKKLGLAAAYQAGFGWALKRGYENIVQMDADFSHNPMDVPRLLDQLSTNDVVVGSRYISGGGISGWGALRQMVSRGGNIYAKRILNLSLNDLTGGFTAWKRSALESIKCQDLKSHGYAFQVELKFRALKNTLRVKEVSIHFENRKYGKSKMTGAIVWQAPLHEFEMKHSPIPHAEPQH